MTDFADADLVTAIVKRRDHLKRRAQARLRKGPVRVSFGVGIELLFVARKHGVPCVDLLGAAARTFTIDDVDILLSAAEALDQEEITTVFDAVHAATALHGGGRLITTDEKILKSDFPAESF